MDARRVIRMARDLGFTLGDIHMLDCVSVHDCLKFDCNPPVSLTRRKSPAQLA